VKEIEKALDTFTHTKGGLNQLSDCLRDGTQREVVEMYLNSVMKAHYILEQSRGSSP
jgi:hypothetical protein